jgi:hypothetical protein
VTAASWAAAAATLAVAGASMHRTLEAGLLAPDAVDRWRVALAAAADPETFRAEFATAQPLLPYHLDGLAAWLVPAATAPAPLLVNALCLAAAAGTWAGWFRRAGHARAVAVPAAVLLAANPVLVALAATGSNAPLLVLLVSWFARAATRLSGDGFVNAAALAGGSLALMLLAAPLGGWILLAAVPAAALLAPRRMLAASAAGTMLAVLFPPLFALLAGLHLNWVFHDDPLRLVRGPEAALFGGVPDLAGAPWLLGPGGTPAGAAAGILAASALAAPLLAAAVLAGRGAWREARPALAVGAVVLAAGLMGATALQLPHPAEAAALLVPVAACAAAAAGASRLGPAGLVLGALAGLAGGWAALGQAPSPALEAWRTAARGQPVLVVDPEEAAVGRALRGLSGVAIDPAVSGAVIPMRGGAEGLVFPTSATLAADLVSGRPTVPYLAVQDPATPEGARDRVGIAIPGLYAGGAQGYRPVASWTRWRLYARDGVPDPLEGVGR